MEDYGFKTSRFGGFGFTYLGSGAEGYMRFCRQAGFEAYESTASGLDLRD